MTHELAIKISIAMVNFHNHQSYIPIYNSIYKHQLTLRITMNTQSLSIALVDAEAWGHGGPGGPGGHAPPEVHRTTWDAETDMDEMICMFMYCLCIVYRFVVIFL